MAVINILKLKCVIWNPFPKSGHISSIRHNYIGYGNTASSSINDISSIEALASFIFSASFYTHTNKIAIYTLSLVVFQNHETSRQASRSANYLHT